MQPAQPNPWFTANFIFLKMINAAGAREAELQGASSVVHGNAVIEAIEGPDDVSWRIVQYHKNVSDYIVCDRTAGRPAPPRLAAM
jgi:hypothetical protein